MPSAQNRGDLAYKDTLDQIAEIIDKYNISYHIIVCGDLNASLHRKDNRRRDQLLKEFMNDNKLSIPLNYPVQPTFFHHNGKYKSQIDYFLFDNNAMTKLNPAVSILPMQATNTSDHTLVTARIQMKVKKSALRPVKIITKPKWNNCDTNLYKAAISEEIQKGTSNKRQDVGIRIK